MGLPQRPSFFWSGYVGPGEDEEDTREFWGAGNISASFFLPPGTGFLPPVVVIFFYINVT